jgi:hypothetical protein
MLYIHPPMNESSCDYPLIPAGIPGIMNMVKDTGGEGVNIPLEMMLDKRFNIESFLKKKDLSVVFVDLHWYVHSFGALYCADICKQIFPESFVILGGMTSSVFAYEVLQHSSVDGIIQPSTTVSTGCTASPYSLQNVTMDGLPSVPLLTTQVH